jgi:hypothetical protein
MSKIALRPLIRSLIGQMVVVEFNDPFWFRGEHPEPRPVLRVIGTVEQPVDDDGFSVVALDYSEQHDMAPVQEGQFVYYGLVRTITMLLPGQTVAFGEPKVGA